MNTAVKYVAELAHVREVTLLGDADLAFWQQRLIKEDLVPLESDGKAQILIVAANAKFMGIRFREVSFSVLVSLPGATRQDAAFLVQAFNSSRCFAFCERAFFKTPYYHGNSLTSTTVPISMRLAQGRETIFQIQMPADVTSIGRKPLREGDESWAGPVFLPRRRDKSHGNLFLADLHGHTRAYSFLPAADTVTITPAAEVFQALIESQFAGKEWLVREDATHRKSKTFSRSQAFPDGES
jgi:hypothetical protein